MDIKRGFKLGKSGSTSRSQKLSDVLRKSLYELSMVNGGLNFNLDYRGKIWEYSKDSDGLRKRKYESIRSIMVSV